MKTLLWSVFVGSVILVGCGQKTDAPPAKTNAQTSTSNPGENPLSAPTDYLGALNKAQKVAEKTVDTASITKAIQMFQAQEDRFPKDLNELVTKHYFPSLPEPPRGMKYDYNPQTGAFKIVKK